MVGQCLTGNGNEKMFDERRLVGMVVRCMEITGLEARAAWVQVQEAGWKLQIALDNYHNRAVEECDSGGEDGLGCKLARNGVSGVVGDMYSGLGMVFSG